MQIAVFTEDYFLCVNFGVICPKIVKLLSMISFPSLKCCFQSHITILVTVFYIWINPVHMLFSSPLHSSVIRGEER